MQHLLGSTTKELEALAQSLGQPAYRGRQLATWIYRRGAETFEAMTDLPRDLRARLGETYVVGVPTVAHRERAEDETVKYLIELEDGQKIESVTLPYPDRVSVCLSTQVGCPAGCTFCATAQGGLARNLTAGEIVGQFLRMQSESERRISHGVYMGMGEPLWNYDAVVKSLRLLGNEVGLSLRNLTVSTVGVVPGIRALAKEDLPITLALSLHAPDDAVRANLIPTARKWKLEEILDACAEYAQATHRNLTFEYLLIGGVNDSPEQARALAALLKAKRLPGNVNLIPFNYVETPQGFRRPSRESIARFREALEKTGRVTTQRMTRGHAISAACGQLRRTVGQAIPLRLTRLTDPSLARMGD
jgi:23S rRNA (adenine2503-C2)-methyltransferase